MISWFRRLSIKAKLESIMLVASIVVALVIMIAVIAAEVLDQRNSIRRQLVLLSVIIGDNSTAALAFEDREAATDMLSSLRVTSSVVYGVIRNQEGEEFAIYQPKRLKDFKDAFAATVQSNRRRYQMNLGYVQIYRPIILDGEQIGSLVIASDWRDLYKNLYRYLLIVAAIVTGAIILAFFISSRLQRIVSEPIRNLGQAMQRIADDQDYSVRVKALTEDEVGTLIERFNDMLAQIEARDAQLERYSATLEDQVVERSKELSEANRKRIAWLENLAGFLRHELKNTIVGFKSSMDLIERRAKSNDLNTYIARGRNSIVYMSKLLDSVGDATSLEATLYDEERVELDVSSLIQARVDDYRSIYPDHDIFCQAEPKIKILANDIRIIQMLDKLVSNAVDHSNLRSPVMISASSEEGVAIISVANEGAKLPQDIEKMFELFVSMRRGEKRNIDNMGLGLYVVRLIAASHDGMVEAHSLTEMGGAVFTVRIPLSN